MSKGKRFFKAAIFAATLFTVAIPAQPDQIAKAQSLLTDAKTLVATEKVKAINDSIQKLEVSTAIYKASGATAKLRETNMVFGKALRLLGSSASDAGNDAEALTYFQRALEKLKPHGAGIELAYAFHNLGYTNSRLKENAEAVARAISSGVI